MPSYQQGIQPPTSLGFQPKKWKEPETPAIKSVVWKSPSVGATRNYGSTPSEVDTMPHRWVYPEKQLSKRKKEDEEGEGPATGSSGSRTLRRGKAVYDAYRTYRGSRTTP
jgi:hypothetical protein